MTIIQIDDTYNNTYMGLSSNFFSSKLDLNTDRENTTENIQGKNQFSRQRILQTKLGEHFYVIYSLVVLTFQTEVTR